MLRLRSRHRLRSRELSLSQASLHLLLEQLVFQCILFFPRSFNTFPLNLRLFLDVCDRPLVVLALGVARGGSAAGGGARRGGDGLGDHGP